MVLSSAFNLRRSTYYHRVTLNNTIYESAVLAFVAVSEKDAPDFDSRLFYFIFLRESVMHAKIM